MLSPRYVRIVMSWIYGNRRVICPILPHKMISKIQLIGNKEVTLFVKLNR